VEALYPPTVRRGNFALIGLLSGRSGLVPFVTNWIRLYLICNCFGFACGSGLARQSDYLSAIGLDSLVALDLRGVPCTLSANISGSFVALDLRGVPCTYYSIRLIFQA
jgi:hypothetical protein